MQKHIKAGVMGASGYAGMDLVELLNRHPCVELVFGTSDSYAGEPIDGTSLHYIPHAEASFDAIDVIFLALPHKASAPVAAQALALNVKVVDLSADLRMNTPESYAQWYDVEHPNPELLPTPYGLPEINRNNLVGIDKVAVPGCYPTTTLLGIYPLLKTGVLKDGAPIIVDAKSGFTGAGRTVKPHLHFAEGFGNLSPYSPGRTHRHVGEIEQEIGKFDVTPGPIIFTPHLIPTDRGLMASIYVNVNGGFTSDQAQDLYEEVYQNEPLVNVLPNGQQATLRHSVRKNNCTISLTPVTPDYIHITSVTDNLRKGAASQAVQDFNLMFDLEETMGLL